MASRLFLLLLGGGDSLVGALLLRSSSGECSHKDVGVCFLQLGQHFLSVLRLRKAAREQLDRVEDLALQCRVSYKGYSSLQHIVTILVVDQPRHNLFHTELATPGLVAELSDEGLVVPVMRSLEDLVDLLGGLRGLEALLNDVGRELELAETNEISRDEIQNLIVPQIVLQLQDVLHQVVAIGILDQVVDAADNDVGQGELLARQAFLQAALHHAAPVLV